jgi:signal peptidase I
MSLESLAFGAKLLWFKRIVMVLAGRNSSGGPSLTRQLFQFLALGSLAVASYFVVSHYFFQSLKVVGVSMYPTLHDSDRCLLNRWTYYLRPPERNDIVVLRDPTDNTFAVKRIIATAGETVYLRDGFVYVNGRRVKEPYLLPGTPTYPYSNLKEQSIRCGRDQYFVLGDNRKNSADSRTYGVVDRQRILGLVVQ